MILLHDKPNLTLKEIVAQLQVSRATIQRVTKELVNRGILERKGGKRFGHWEIHEKSKSNIIIK